jgi:cytochrome c oxidase assembly protein subunit 11
MRRGDDIARANRRLAYLLAAVAVGMFGFGYALAPLYEALCQALGIGGRTARTELAELEHLAVDKSRTVTVEFTGQAMAGLPWEFRPLVNKLEVHPGERVRVEYYVRNRSNETIVAQAVPSVTPGTIAGRFKKLECFCFTQQTLAPGESRHMPVVFVVDPGLSRDVNTITLSYAFYNTDKTQAQRFGGAPLTVRTDAHSEHGPTRQAGG